MKVNELVWKKMSLCESESESSFVDQVGQTSSGECKANNLNSASSRYFEWTVFTLLHHCIIASNMPWSGCLVWPLRPGPLPAAQGGGGALPLLQLRLLSSSKVLGKWSASKAQKGGSQIFSNKVAHPIFSWYSPPSTQIFWLSARAALAEAS